MSLIILLAANAAALAVAWYENFSVGELVFVYWLQSVVIGAMQVIRIAKLRRFVPDLGKTYPPVSESVGIKIWIAAFFAVHYGVFHLVYLIFILVATGGDVGEPLGILACLAGFLVHHALSLRHNLKSDAEGLPSLKGLLWQPYPRIIPMHAMILTGVLFWQDAGPLAILIFGTLKTIADVLMHIHAHRVPIIKDVVRNPES